MAAELLRAVSKLMFAILRQDIPILSVLRHARQFHSTFKTPFPIILEFSHRFLLLNVLVVWHGFEAGACMF